MFISFKYFSSSSFYLLIISFEILLDKILYDFDLFIRNISEDTRIAKLIRISKESVKVKCGGRQNTNKERVLRNPII